MRYSRLFVPVSLALVSVFAAFAVEAETFRWVAMPDNQYYAVDRAQNVPLPTAGVPSGYARNAITDVRGSSGAIYSDITQWIVDQNADADPDNDIDFVVQLGDLTENGNDLNQWALAVDAMTRLSDAGIPFQAVEGNHDCQYDYDGCRDVVLDPNSGSGYAEKSDGQGGTWVADGGISYHKNYLDNFGPNTNNFGGVLGSQFAAVSPSGLSTYMRVSVDSRNAIGFIGLPVGVPQVELDWAKEVIADNPEVKFVVSMHIANYDAIFTAGRDLELVTAPALSLNDPIPIYGRSFEPYPLYVNGVPVTPATADEATREAALIAVGGLSAAGCGADGLPADPQQCLDTLQVAQPSTYGSLMASLNYLENLRYAATGEQANFGQMVYEELTQELPNVLMVQSGHTCFETLRTDGTNGTGANVVEVLTDYQCGLNGGDGTIRVYEFDFDTNTFRWETVITRAGIDNDPTMGPRPHSDRRTPMDAFVDNIFLTYAYILPLVVSQFEAQLEGPLVASGALSVLDGNENTIPDCDESEQASLGGGGSAFPADEPARSQACLDFIQTSDASTYFAILGEALAVQIGQQVTVPESPAYLFLTQHPDFDEPAEQAYYTNKLNARFGGSLAAGQNNVPAGWENPARFEGLWLLTMSEDETGAALSRWADPFDAGGATSSAEAAAVIAEASAEVLTCNDPATGGAINKFNRCPSGSLVLQFENYSLMRSAVPMLPPLLALLSTALVAMVAMRRRA